MPASWTWVIYLILGLVTFPLSSGIQCYFCTSITETRCHDTSLFYSQVQTEQPSECSQEKVDTTLGRIRQDLSSPDGERGNFDCIKVELMNPNPSNLNRTVIRGCAQGQTRKFDPCVDIRRQFTNIGDMMSCNVCKTDSCNSATATNPAFWCLLPALAILREIVFIQ